MHLAGPEKFGWVGVQRPAVWARRRVRIQTVSRRKNNWSWYHDVNGLSSRCRTPGETLQRVWLLLAVCAWERMICPTYFPFSVWDEEIRGATRNLSVLTAHPRRPRAGGSQEPLLSRNKSLGFVLFSRACISAFNFIPVRQGKAFRTLSYLWPVWTKKNIFFGEFGSTPTKSQTALRSHRKSVTFLFFGFAWTVTV